MVTIISTTNRTPRGLPRRARHITPNHRNTRDAASTYFRYPPIHSADAGIAAVVLTITTTYVSPPPDPTEPGVNEQVLNAGNPEQASVTLIGNVLALPKGLTSRL